MKTDSTPGRRFYERQIELLEAGDVDRLIDEQYRKDATLVGFDVLVKGSDALREHFREYLDHLGGLEVLSTDKFTETEDSIFFEATVLSKLGEAKVYDVFLLRDGRISHHFTGVTSVVPLRAQEA
ncbi:MAG: nuclear transport factor 2 family protein [Trueperaceae bacterium]